MAAISPIDDLIERSKVVEDNSLDNLMSKSRPLTEQDIHNPYVPEASKQLLRAQRGQAIANQQRQLIENQYTRLKAMGDANGLTAITAPTTMLKWSVMNAIGTESETSQMWLQAPMEQDSLVVQGLLEFGNALGNAAGGETFYSRALKTGALNAGQVYAMRRLYLERKAAEFGMEVDEPGSLKRLAASRKAILDQGSSEELQYVMGAENASEFFSRLLENPTTALEVFGSSAIGYLAGEGPILAAAGATGNPGLIMGSIYLGSLEQDLAAEVLSDFEEKGIDTTNPEQLRLAFANKALLDDTLSRKVPRAMTIGAVDAMTNNLGGTILRTASKTGATRLATKMLNVVGGTAGGMVGEAGGQVAESGKVTGWADVYMEGIASVGPETAQQVFGGIDQAAENIPNMTPEEMVRAYGHLSSEQLGVMISSLQKVADDAVANKATLEELRAVHARLVELDEQTKGSGDTRVRYKIQEELRDIKTVIAHREKGVNNEALKLGYERNLQLIESFKKLRDAVTEVEGNRDLESYIARVYQNTAGRYIRRAEEVTEEGVRQAARGTRTKPTESTGTKSQAPEAAKHTGKYQPPMGFYYDSPSIRVFTTEKGSKYLFDKNRSVRKESVGKDAGFNPNSVLTVFVEEKDANALVDWNSRGSSSRFLGLGKQGITLGAKEGTRAPISISYEPRVGLFPVELIGRAIGLGEIKGQSAYKQTRVGHRITELGPLQEEDKHTFSVLAKPEPASTQPSLKVEVNKDETQGKFKGVKITEGEVTKEFTVTPEGTLQQKGQLTKRGRRTPADIPQPKYNFFSPPDTFFRNIFGKDEEKGTSAYIENPLNGEPITNMDEAKKVAQQLNAVLDEDRFEAYQEGNQPIVAEKERVKRTRERKSGKAPAERAKQPAQPAKQEISTPQATDTTSLYDKAVDAVIEAKRGSVSVLQRKLKVSYDVASKLMEELVAKGIVGPLRKETGYQAREVLVDKAPPQQSAQEPVKVEEPKKVESKEKQPKPKGEAKPTPSKTKQVIDQLDQAYKEAAKAEEQAKKLALSDANLDRFEGNEVVSTAAELIGLNSETIKPLLTTLSEDPRPLTIPEAMDVRAAVKRLGTGDYQDLLVAANNGLPVDTGLLKDEETVREPNDAGSQLNKLSITIRKFVRELVKTNRDAKPTEGTRIHRVSDITSEDTTLYSGVPLPSFEDVLSVIDLTHRAIKYGLSRGDLTIRAFNDLRARTIGKGIPSEEIQTSGLTPEEFTTLWTHANLLATRAYGSALKKSAKALKTSIEKVEELNLPPRSTEVADAKREVKERVAKLVERARKETKLAQPRTEPNKKGGRKISGDPLEHVRKDRRPTPGEEAGKDTKQRVREATGQVKDEIMVKELDVLKKLLKKFNEGSKDYKARSKSLARVARSLNNLSRTVHPDLLKAFADKVEDIFPVVTGRYRNTTQPLPVLIETKSRKGTGFKLNKAYFRGLIENNLEFKDIEKNLTALIEYVKAKDEQRRYAASEDVRKTVAAILKYTRSVATKAKVAKDLTVKRLTLGVETTYETFKSIIGRDENSPAFQFLHRVPERLYNESRTHAQSILYQVSDIVKASIGTGLESLQTARYWDQPVELELADGTKEKIARGKVMYGYALTTDENRLGVLQKMHRREQNNISLDVLGEGTQHERSVDPEAFGKALTQQEKDLAVAMFDVLRRDQKLLRLMSATLMEETNRPLTINPNHVPSKTVAIHKEFLAGRTVANRQISAAQHAKEIGFVIERSGSNSPLILFSIQDMINDYANETTRFAYTRRHYSKMLSALTNPEVISELQRVTGDSKIDTVLMEKVQDFAGNIGSKDQMLGNLFRKATTGLAIKAVGGSVPSGLKSYGGVFNALMAGVIDRGLILKHMRKLLTNPSSYVPSSEKAQAILRKSGLLADKQSNFFATEIALAAEQSGVPSGRKRVFSHIANRLMLGRYVDMAVNTMLYDAALEQAKGNERKALRLFEHNLGLSQATASPMFSTEWELRAKQNPTLTGFTLFSREPARVFSMLKGAILDVTQLKGRAQREAWKKLGQTLAYALMGIYFQYFVTRQWSILRRGGRDTEALTTDQAKLLGFAREAFGIWQGFGPVVSEAISQFTYGSGRVEGKVASPMIEIAATGMNLLNNIRKAATSDGTIVDRGGDTGKSRGGKALLAAGEGGIDIVSLYYGLPLSAPYKELKGLMLTLFQQDRKFLSDLYNERKDLRAKGDSLTRKEKARLAKVESLYESLRQSYLAKSKNPSLSNSVEAQVKRYRRLLQRTE